MSAKRGRPLSPEGALDLLRVDVQSLGYELVPHDQFEMAAYEALDLSLAQIETALREGRTDEATADIAACRRVLADVRRRDLGHENRLHREIVAVARQGAAS